MNIDEIKDQLAQGRPVELARDYARALLDNPAFTNCTFRLVGRRGIIEPEPRQRDDHPLARR